MSPSPSAPNTAPQPDPNENWLLTPDADVADNLAPSGDVLTDVQLDRLPGVDTPRTPGFTMDTADLIAKVEGLSHIGRAYKFETGRNVLVGERGTTDANARDRAILQASISERLGLYIEKHGRHALAGALAARRAEHLRTLERPVDDRNIYFQKDVNARLVQVQGKKVDERGKEVDYDEDKFARWKDGELRQDDDGRRKKDVYSAPLKQWSLSSFFDRKSQRPYVQKSDPDPRHPRNRAPDNEDNRGRHIPRNPDDPLYPANPGGGLSSIGRKGYSVALNEPIFYLQRRREQSRLQKRQEELEPYISSIEHDRVTQEAAALTEVINEIDPHYEQRTTETYGRLTEGRAVIDGYFSMWPLGDSPETTQGVAENAREFIQQEREAINSLPSTDHRRAGFLNDHIRNVVRLAHRELIANGDATGEYSYYQDEDGDVGVLVRYRTGEGQLQEKVYYGDGSLREPRAPSAGSHRLFMFSDRKNADGSNWERPPEQPTLVDRDNKNLSEADVQARFTNACDKWDFDRSTANTAEAWQAGRDYLTLSQAKVDDIRREIIDAEMGLYDMGYESRRAADAMYKADEIGEDRRFETAQAVIEARQQGRLTNSAEARQATTEDYQARLNEQFDTVKAAQDRLKAVPELQERLRLAKERLAAESEKSNSVRASLAFFEAGLDIERPAESESRIGRVALNIRKAAPVTGERMVDVERNTVIDPDGSVEWQGGTMDTEDGRLTGDWRIRTDSTISIMKNGEEVVYSMNGERLRANTTPQAQVAGPPPPTLA